MIETDPLLQATQVLQDLGLQAVFLYLFIRCQNAHNVTIEKHLEDLREIAGLKMSLSVSAEKK